MRVVREETRIDQQDDDASVEEGGNKDTDSDQVDLRRMIRLSDPLYQRYNDLLERGIDTDNEARYGL